MTLRILSDVELERRLHTDPDNLQILLEAARRFPRTAERAEEADLEETLHKEAAEEIEVLTAEIQTLKDELKQAEDRGDDLQKELDDAPTREQLDAAEAEIARLNTVLELVADA